MGVTEINQEFASPIAPGRLFNALILNSNTLLPKLLPQSIKSVETLQGDGGAGSIEQVNFTESSHFKYVKHRINELDKEKLTCKYSMIEGDMLGDKVERIEYDIKFESSDDGGCICKMTSEYHAVEGHEIKEDDIRAGKESAKGIYKVIEAYLLQNPHAFA
ncbi:major allergen Pru ar 1-like [Primulina huaijiensis]|uniref:major allergen Pru ar 1-like n=1 Tax=Primulina huaijiensis TaxID=1492673 RepID=UPI003CC76806